MQAQDSPAVRPILKGRGYLPSFLGSLGGAIPGGLVSMFLGIAYGETQVDPNAGGLFGDAFVPIGFGILFGLIGTYAGAVLGCWATLHLLKDPLAGRTAAILAALMPAAFFALVGLDYVIAAEYLGFAFFGLPFVARTLALRNSR